jgi:hypothetical protein
MKGNIMRKTMKIAAGVGLTAAAGIASAALPAEATAAFTGLSTNVSDIMTAVWPIVAAVVGGFALIKLFKKGASKAV